MRLQRHSWLALVLSCPALVAVAASEKCYAQSTLVGRVGWVHMQRSDPSDLPIMNDSGSNTIFNANDFSFDRQSGIDASLIYHSSDLHGIDIRYLWIGEHSDDFSFAVPAGANTVRTDPITIFVGPADAIATFDSQLQTAEINLRRNYGYLTLLAGFRYVDFDEQLQAHFQLPTSTETDTWTTRNNLYGFQLGSEALFWDDGVRFRVEGIAKAGIYYNDARSRFLAERSAAPTTFSSDSAGDVAFLGELGLYGTYRITQCLAVRAGYQLLWINGVALAPEQIPNTASFNFPGQIASTIDTGGSAFYHGANVGIELSW